MHYTSYPVTSTHHTPLPCPFPPCTDIGRKQKYLGVYDTEVEAAVAYNESAQDFFGSGAKLNHLSPSEVAAYNDSLRQFFGDDANVKRLESSNA